LKQTVSTQKPTGRGRLLHRLGFSLAILLMLAGVALLANLAWQLWGTGIATGRAQHRLGQQFSAATSGGSTKPANGGTKPASGTTSTAGLPSPLGTVVGHLVIPHIGVNDYVVEGVGSAQLAEGPGHYPGTAAIGQPGNVGIAGHRTTHGAPFYNLNDLRPGDLIYLTNTAKQTFVYQVTSQSVVSPGNTTVLDPTPTAMLTLTTCTPRYSASHRLIVHAALRA
jgi:sortase A